MRRFRAERAWLIIAMWGFVACSAPTAKTRLMLRDPNPSQPPSQPTTPVVDENVMGEQAPIGDTGEAPLPNLRFILDLQGADSITPQTTEPLRWRAHIEQRLPDNSIRTLDASETAQWQIQIHFAEIEVVTENSHLTDVQVSLNGAAEGFYTFQVRWKHESGYVHTTSSPNLFVHVDATPPQVGLFRFSPIPGFNQSFLVESADAGRLDDGHLIVFVCPEDTPLSEHTNSDEAEISLPECEILATDVGSPKAVADATVIRSYIPGLDLAIGDLEPDTTHRALACVADAAGNSTCAWDSPAQDSQALETLEILYDGDAIERKTVRIYNQQRNVDVPLRLTHMRNGKTLVIDSALNTHLAHNYQLNVDISGETSSRQLLPLLPLTLPDGVAAQEFIITPTSANSNASQALSITLVQDAEPPVAGNLLIELDSSLAPDTVVTYSWTATDNQALDAASSYWRAVDTIDWQLLEPAVILNQESTSRSFVWGTRPAGPFEIQVRVRDQAGHEVILQETKS